MTDTGKKNAWTQKIMIKYLNLKKKKKYKSSHIPQNNQLTFYSIA